MAYGHDPRESIFPGTSSSINFLDHLEECVKATEDCAITAYNGLGALQKGIADYPRLTKVLRNKHHFLLLPATTVQAHKEALSISLQPQIEQLITKAETSISSSSIKIQRLEERLAILQSAKIPMAEPIKTNYPTTFVGTGDDDDDGHGGEDDGGSKRHLDGIDMKELSMAQRRKILMLKGKRDRLEKERAELLGQS